MSETGDLTDVQLAMLEAGRFHVDGWTSSRGRTAAAALERLGFVRSFEGKDSQSTSINYDVTEAGLAALRASRPTPRRKA